MSGELSFVELGVEDAGRGRAFYSSLFGWAFEPGPGGEGFVITSLVTAAGIHGGDKAAAPYIFFRVEDIEVAAKRVVELGGTVDTLDVGGDTEYAATFGEFRLCRDDQGSHFGLHQPPAV